MSRLLKDLMKLESFTTHNLFVNSEVNDNIFHPYEQVGDYVGCEKKIYWNPTFVFKKTKLLCIYFI